MKRLQFYRRSPDTFVQVEENVAAAVEVMTIGKDEELLKEVEAILEPVKNQTWPSGIQKS